MKYYIPLNLKWNFGSPPKISIGKVNRLISHVKKVCENSKKLYGYKTIKLKEFNTDLENKTCNFIVHPDPSYSVDKIIEIFDIYSEENRWEVLDYFTHESTDYISYCLGINPKYRLPILNYEYHGELQKFLIESSKKAGVTYIDSKIAVDNISIYISVPFNLKINTVIASIKAQMTSFIRKQLPTLFSSRYYQDEPKNNKKPQFWSSGTFISICKKEPPYLVHIQPTLDSYYESFEYKPDIKYIDNEIEKIKSEMIKELGIPEININRNMYLLYKIQKLRSKINESYYKKQSKYIFELTPRSEKYSNHWGIAQCKNKNLLDQFIRDTQSYIRESLFASNIINASDYEVLKIINALRIDVSHDTGMSYDSRTKDNIKIATDFYQDIIGKTIPECEDDYLFIQSKVLMMVLNVLKIIEKKYC
jgi:REP element-mobilizing transposase RayT